MPIYEYQCKSCGGVQEVMQKIDDPAPSDCPTCHKGPVAKMLSRTAFILKGNGWYVTDFRDKGKKAAPSGDSDAAAPAPATAAPSSTTTPTESAPAAAPSTPAPAPKDGGSTAATGCGAGPCAH